MPIVYQTICFNHKLLYSLPKKGLVAIIDITLITKNSKMGIRIVLSTLNLDICF